MSLTIRNPRGRITCIEQLKIKILYRFALIESGGGNVPYEARQPSQL